MENIYEDKELLFNVIHGQIGYTFNNNNLLEQAFTRRSFSEEQGGENNEVLEFIGDKVLDLIVVKYLTEKYSNAKGICEKFTPGIERSLKYCFGQIKFPEENVFISDYSEAELTELKKVLVQKKTLATRIDKMGLSDFLLMGKGDVLQNRNDENSVKEDLFEAILGAIAIDCNWNMEKLQNAVMTMLAPEAFLSEDTEDDYVSLIHQWSVQKTGAIPMYKYKQASYTSSWYMHEANTVYQRFPTSYDYSKLNFHCYIGLSKDLPIFCGFGSSQNEARKNVCKLAYDYLESKGLWLSIRDEIKNPNKEEAINQLEILARRGYFSIPIYNFEQTYDKNGNPIWKCICSINEESKTFSVKASSKKEAKKAVAYKMLLYVLKD